jgi:hypothetical protein
VMSELEQIPGANRDCEFCKGPLHFGVCEEMREARRQADGIEAGRPAPITRSGP